MVERDVSGVAPEASSGLSAPGPEIGRAPTVEPDGGATLLGWAWRMRAEAPVWREETGHVHVFRHEDIMRVVSDPAAFSSDLSGQAAKGQAGGQLLLLDPPQHGKMRRLVSRAFTNRMIADLEPQIQQITSDLLDAVDGGSFDLIEMLANPLPVTVIAAMLGVPVSDRDKFQGWANQLLSTDRDDPESVKRLGVAAQEIGAYLQEFVTARREAPRDDLISTLVQAEVDGERLGDQDVISFAALLLLAGHVTTSVLLGNALLCLDDNPEEMRAVRLDRSRVPAVIEETLRLRPPFTRVERITTGDVEIAGVPVEKGTQIALWLLSANRDDQVFDSPDRFLPDRPNNRQMAFGHGIHYCIGAPIARLEARIVLNMLLDRFAGIRVDRSTPLSFHGTNIFGARTLPLTVRHG